MIEYEIVLSKFLSLQELFIMLQNIGDCKVEIGGNDGQLYLQKQNNKRIRIGKYIISSHAQNQTVTPSRKVTKVDMVDNLLTKPNGIPKPKLDDKGRLSYSRVGKKHTTSINPKTNVVATIKPISRQDIHSFNLTKKGDKYRANKNKQ